ncbi:hypothetical protein F511_20702 [Dorcoceras hygrometricum]|uniref:Uncharacterized protein n=1 Tax=Dorcoceras hygrometricum TaxID=472368 RepID=A0A2Z7D2C4_9LAMI|nr:hypothetical protein F511_20702 [Dorcoceras hygrometricum]
MSNGSVRKIEKVGHVPRLTRNLLSVGQLDDKGRNVTFGDGSWKVSKGAMIVARGKKTGTLYMISSCRETLAALDAGANSSLWHCRLGHMSEKGMKILMSNGKLPELKSVEHKLCESCIFGKQRKVSFSKGGREPKAAKLSWFILMYGVHLLYHPSEAQDTMSHSLMIRAENFGFIF